MLLTQRKCIINFNLLFKAVNNLLMLIYYEKAKIVKAYINL